MIMRYIEFDSFKPSNKWSEKARQASEELEKKSSREERMAFIKAKAQVWRDLRAELIEKFGNRCWFTDAEETVAQLDVEHFRPKAEAVDLDGKVHEGYWWLAFELSNLRLAGQIPNRQHKRCYFPLQPNSFRACATNRRWQEELPIFLDPINPLDVAMVAYDESGCMRPSASAVTKEDQERVKLTDKYLGLSAHQPLVEARQSIWNDCRGIIEKIKKLLAEEEEFGTSTSRTRGERRCLMRNLIEKTLPTSPFASVARSCILMSGEKWLVEALVNISPY